MPTTIDYSSLLYPVSAYGVAQYRAKAKRIGSRGAHTSAAQVLEVGTVVLFSAVGFGSIVGLIAIAVTVYVTPGDHFWFHLPSRSSLIAGGVWALFALVFLGLIIGGGYWVRRGRQWESWYRLEKFASDNGFHYSVEDDAPSYSGSIFQLGEFRATRDHLTSTKDRMIGIGNHRWRVGSSEKSERTWGFLALNLPRTLPHMLLDSTANDGVFKQARFPGSISKTQVVSLEGDFNKHFTLYCPRDYARDALYIFTPDLMALLVDEAGTFDVEIIDNWLFAYSTKPLKLTDPKVMHRLFTIVDTVGAKTVDRASNYADERIGIRELDMVARQGRRLAGPSFWLAVALPIGALAVVCAVLSTLTH